MSTVTEGATARRFELIAPEEVGRMTGLEAMRAMVEGRLPPPPIAAVMQMDLVEIGDGSAVFEGRPGQQFYNPIGVVHGGWPATLLDSCMGCAIHTTMAAGARYTTLELKVNYVRSVMADSGPLRAEGRVIHRGQRTATADGRLVDSDGKLFAHGSTTCIIL